MKSTLQGITYLARGLIAAVMLVVLVAGFMVVFSTPAHAQTCSYPSTEWHPPTQQCYIPCKEGETRGEDGVCRYPLCPPREVWYPELGYCVPITPPNCAPGQPCEFEPVRAPSDLIKQRGLSCRAVRVQVEPACTQGAGCEVDQAKAMALLLTVVMSCGK